MKLILALLIVTALMSARAQQESPIVPAQPLPPAAPKGPAAPKLIEKRIEKTVEDSLAPVLDVVEQATANGLRVAQRAIAAAGQNADAQLQDFHNTFSVYTSGPSSSRGNRSLVIQFSEPDPVANANAEEDLAIMSRILRKAVGSSQDEGRRVVLGTSVDGSVFGSASGARNIYLDGYGALFLLTVRYPLIAPTEKPDEPKTKDTSSDEWKIAREEELESSGRAGYGGASGFSQSWVWSSSGRGSAEDFDADKVEKLKTALLEGLKNATHIRALKPNDFVTVVVQGAEAIRVVESGKRKVSATLAGKPAPSPADADGKGPGNTPSKASAKSSRSRVSLGETVMTMRIKKSDADAFAQGKLDLDAFRKKAAIQAYFRKPTDPTSASVFLPATR